MGIEFAKFPQGLPINSQLEGVVKPLEEIRRGRVKAELLAAGEYDITPIHPDGLRTEYIYNLIVHDAGDATFRMIPRSADNSTVLSKPGSPTSVRRGGRMFQIPQEFGAVPIALRNADGSGYKVYAYFRHVPGRSPQKS